MTNHNSNHNLASLYAKVILPICLMMLSPAAWALDSVAWDLKTPSTSARFMYTTQVAHQNHFSNPAHGENPGIVYQELSFTRSMGSSRLHLANVAANDQRYDQVGLSVAGTRLDLFNGYGRLGSNLRSRFAAMDPFLFHGGVDRRFAYQGYAIQRNVHPGLAFTYTHGEIESRGLESRQARALGVAGEHFDFTYTAVQRGRQRVGAAWSAGARYGAHRLALDYLENNNGAHYAALQYSQRRKGIEYRVELKQSRNPRFVDKNDNRLMMHIGFRFGQGFKPLHADETDQEESDGQTGPNKALIGAGVVGAALALSSGSSGSDSQVRLTARDQAARQRLNGINPVSVAQNREHGGYIFRNPDGSFSSTIPVAGTLASVTLPPVNSVIPPSSTLSASYHTHGGPDPRFDNENFSQVDILSDRLLGVDGYLGTPAGVMKLHQVNTGAILTLSTIAN